MQKVQFYTKDHCPLCEEAFALVKMLQFEYEFELEEIDIYKDDALLEKYQLLIPVVKTNGKEINCEQINIASLENIIKKSLILLCLCGIIKIGIKHASLFCSNWDKK